jgi:hypothetical protein
MIEKDMTSLVSWSVITAVFLIITSILYRRFSRKNKNESSSY